MVKTVGSQALAEQEHNAVVLRKAAGEWLKSMREARGLSQTELAELVGVDYYSFVSQIENGRGRIPAGRFAKWADAFGMKRKEFVYHILRYYEPVVFELLFEEDEQQSA